MAQGTKLFLDVVGTLDHEEWDLASGLPGWSRRHLVAHVAANADAIGNLVRWAATGVESPMYISANDRADGIAKGEQLSPNELASWADRSARELAVAMTQLDHAQWEHLVVTAQGRTVPATETPWMRSREVMVHAVDLGTGLSFADLPDGFLKALREDIETKRGGSPNLVGNLAEIVAYLAGRSSTDVTSPSGEPAPPLGPWL